jgi:hypothetical protein
MDGGGRVAIVDANVPGNEIRARRFIVRTYGTGRTSTCSPPGL